MRTFSIVTAVAVSLPLAASASNRPWVGDPVNGAKLFKKECAACHGDDGAGGRTGIALTDSGRMNAIIDGTYFAVVEQGEGVKKDTEAHVFKDKLAHLDIWDVVAHGRSMHLGIDDFFPQSSRYLAGKYTIDKHGLKRIKKAVGKAPKDAEAQVYTFFDFPDEEGKLTFVPSEPILLDQMKKNLKAGYLVFLPFTAEGFDGEIGIGMDSDGAIKKIAVHGAAKNADLLNKSLSRFESMGKKGQKKPFAVGGGKSVKQLSDAVFAAYMRAMETVTMYDREENDRTWADEP